MDLAGRRVVDVVADGRWVALSHAMTTDLGVVRLECA
jgi:hypothetical protein